MRISWSSFITIVFIGLLLFSCAPELPERFYITPTPLPIPNKLMELPTEVRLKCTGDKNLDRSGIALWTKFEIPKDWTPDDSETCYFYQNRDCFLWDQVGGVKMCAPVTVTKLEWSGQDSRYYVFIEAEKSTSFFVNGKGDLQGWIDIEYVEFDE